MIINMLQNSEIPSALEMAWTAFNEEEGLVCTDQTLVSFKNLLNDNQLISQLKFYGAYIEGQLIGIIATRDETHISMLCVNKNFRNKSVAKLLFYHILDISEKLFFTVYSPEYTLEMYLKFGFVDTNIEETIDSVKFKLLRYKKTLY